MHIKSGYNIMFVNKRTVVSSERTHSADFSLRKLGKTGQFSYEYIPKIFHVTVACVQYISKDVLIEKKKLS